MNSIQKRAIERWQAHGLDCVIAMGAWAPCGYVRLPADDPRRQTDWEGFDVHVHGGLTYGPDQDGWVGFDAGHAGDVWAPDDLIGALEPEMFKAAMTIQRWHADVPVPWSITWTMERFRSEVSHLADQLAHRRADQ